MLYTFSRFNKILEMLIVNSQRQQFENWINNYSIKEPEKTNFYNWIVNSPLDIFIPRIPPIECGSELYQREFRFDIGVHINGIDWFHYSNEKYSYISIDSEVNHFLNWIEKVPTSSFFIDKREDYCNFPAHFPGDDYQHYVDTFKAYKKVSIVLIEAYEKTK